MARGPYKEPTAMWTLRKLVAFAEGVGEGYPVTLLAVGQGILSDEAWKAIHALTSAQRRGLQGHLRAFLYAALGDDTAAPLPVIRVTLVPLTKPPTQTSRLPWPPQLFHVNGPPRDVLLYQVATLLAVVGVERLRRCLAPDCRRLFVKVGRREFCSDRCQRRVFLSTYNPFAAKPRRTTTAKTTPKKERFRHGKHTKTR